ncbi:MAG TPA: hypothetical protein VFE50_04545 [Cyclobacteriaceae bacterium]|nr:hypothetical protein [Cyclobacteriaceae bacterium]
MKAVLYGTILFVAAGLLVWISWDILFSPPTHKEGVIKELLFIDGRNVATYTPYQGRKVGDHAIVVAKDEQYIAIVTGEGGQDFQVHCSKKHYEQLKVGDKLKYKKYEGETFHIRYFAHYEEED